MNFVLEENGQVVMVDDLNPQEIVVQELTPVSPATMTELAPIRMKKQKRKEPLKIRPMSEVEICIEVEEPQPEKNSVVRQYRSKKNATPVTKEKVEKVKKDKKEVKTINLEIKDSPKKARDDEKMETSEEETRLEFDKEPPAKKEKETMKKDKEPAKKEKVAVKEIKDIPSEDNKDTQSTDDNSKKQPMKRKKRKRRRNNRWG